MGGIGSGKKRKQIRTNFGVFDLREYAAKLLSELAEAKQLSKAEVLRTLIIEEHKRLKAA